MLTFKTSHLVIAQCHSACSAPPTLQRSYVHGYIYMCVCACVCVLSSWSSLFAIRRSIIVKSSPTIWVWCLTQYATYKQMCNCILYNIYTYICTYIYLLIYRHIYKHVSQNRFEIILKKFFINVFFSLNLLIFLVQFVQSIRVFLPQL